VLNNLLDITKPINVNSNQRQTNVAVDWSSLAVIVKSTLMSISIRIIWVDIFKVNMSLPKINSVYLRGCYTIHTGNGIILPLFVLGKKNNIYIYIYIYIYISRKIILSVMTFVIANNNVLAKIIMLSLLIIFLDRTMATTKYFIVVHGSDIIYYNTRFIVYREEIKAWKNSQKRIPIQP
jgi:hypothetical protein